VIDKIIKLVSSAIVANDNGIQVTIVIPQVLWVSLKKVVVDHLEQQQLMAFVNPAPVVIDDKSTVVKEDRDGRESEDVVEGSAVGGVGGH